MTLPREVRKRPLG